MAACDNLHGNRAQWNELREFLMQTHPEYITQYMREEPKEDAQEQRICYIASIQEYLIENCPLAWVKEQLIENFQTQRMICGKAHHEKDCRDKVDDM